MNKTMNDYRKEWGLKRYVTALGIMSGFVQEHPHPISREDMDSLQNESADAFELFKAYMLHGVETTP